MYVLKDENDLENSSGNIATWLGCFGVFYFVNSEKIEEVLKKFVDKRLSTAAFKCADVGALFRKRNDRLFDMRAE